MNKTLRVQLVAAIIVAWAPTAAFANDAVDADRIREARDRALSHEHVQTELPNPYDADGGAYSGSDSNHDGAPSGASGAIPPASARDRALSDRGAAAPNIPSRVDRRLINRGRPPRDDARASRHQEMLDRPDRERSGAGGIGAIIGKLAIIALIGVVIAVLVSFVLGFLGRDRQSDADADGGLEDDTLPLPPLPAHAKLAQEGDFVAALHVVVLEVLRRVVNNDPARLRHDLTAREIVSNARLEPAPRDVLRQLVAAAERAIFAEEPTQRSDYEAVLQLARAFDSTGRGIVV